MENMPPQEICRSSPKRSSRLALECIIHAEANLEVRGRHNIQFIPTRGSVLLFFLPESERLNLTCGVKWNSLVSRFVRGSHLTMGDGRGSSGGGAGVSILTS